MNLLSSLKNLVFPDAGMVCPRCEKPLEAHDEAACERRMSRRYFFGVTAGAIAAVAGAALLPESGIAIAHGGVPLQEFVVSKVVEGNSFLTVEMITYEALYVLRHQLDVQRYADRTWGEEFENDGLNIGETLNIRKPMNYLTVTSGSLQPGDRFTMAGVYKA